MRSAIAITLRIVGMLLMLVGGFAAIAVWKAPDAWARVLEAQHVQAIWLLHLPLGAAISLAVAGVLALMIGMSDDFDAPVLSESTSHGSARFATTAEIRAKGHLNSGVVLCMENGAELEQQISVSGDPYWKVTKPGAFICTKKLHVLVEGPNGAGKDECIVLPTLLTDVSRSYVVNDPKGKVYEWTAGYRSAYTHILRFAPCDEATHRCNPLLDIPIGTPREVTEAARISNVLVGSTAREEMSSRIYLKSCETLLTCAILHVIHRAPAAERNLPGVLRLLTDPNKDEDDIAKAICKDPPPGSELAMSSLRRLAQDGRMLQGAFTTALDVLNFCQMPLVASAISGSDFAPSDLSQRKTPVTLYLEFPFRDADVLRPLARLMIDSLLNHHTFKREHDTAYMLNELYSLGNILALLRGIGELREFGVQLILFVQSESQLFSAYGKDEALTIIDNCRARVTLGVTGQQSAENISAMLGKATLVRPRLTQAVSKRSIIEQTVTDTRGEGEQARELRTPDEVRANNGDSVFVLLPELRAYHGKKALRYALPELNRRSLLPAPVPRVRALKAVGA